MSEIKTAGPEDVLPLIELAEELWEEGRYRVFGCDRTVIAESVMETVYGTTGLAIVAVDKGQYLGGIIGKLEQFFCVRKFFAVEHGFYLRPEYRAQGRIALRMLNAYMELAKARGAEEMHGMATNMIDDERVARLYKAAGFEPVGPVLRRVL